MRKKKFDKIQHPFMMKTLNKVGTEKMYLNIIKTIYAIPQLTSHSMEKLKSFPPRS